MSTSILSSAFDLLVTEFVHLDHAWTHEHSRSGLRHAFDDARHHLCHAIHLLDDVTHDPAHLVPHGAYDLLDGATIVLAHEAYLSMLALGQLVHTALEHRWAAVGALEVADAAVWHMLEELAPFVSRADGGLRRTLLEGVPIEVVLEDLRRSLDV